jgi:GDP-4-dehydro-6-deoxy-D-mannose reductase
MKVLVVGGTGFVGKYLVQHILENYNWSVNVTHTDKLTEKDNRIEYHELNILNFVDVKSLLLSISPDLIFHLAAQSSVVSSWENPQNTVQVNVIGTLNILEAVRLLKNKPKILLIGSSEEYGAIEKHELPINEENALRPRNTYAITKIAQNHLGKLYSDAYDMEIVIARPFNHVGPGQSEKFVVSDFCKQVAEIENGIHEERILVGNLESRRDFTDVRDIVKVYPKLILSGVSGEIYNVGSGTDISTKQNIRFIKKRY